MSPDPHLPWRERVAAAARTWLPGSSTERIVLGALLLLALVLRCWDLPHIPYTHDELSALIRVDYPSLHDAISKGVVGVDTHPPGVHAFLWAWTKLFGTGEGVVKLPFIVLSVLAIVLLYRFAQAWVGGVAALVLTALMATLQYTVMYGQIARPYAVGLFTTALLADQLTRYLGNGSRRALIGIAAGALLSGWTHHFALMLAALMYATGLFLVSKEQRKGYLIAGGAAVLLYLPNVPLFFAQLGWKGLDEWLQAPTSRWVFDYMWWLAHCSSLFAVVFAGVVLLAGWLKVRNKGTIAPVWAIALLWGALPLVIGYAYSVWRSPVLQYSVVLFSFPYALLGMLAGLRHLRPALGPVLAGVVAATSVLTLVTVRRHYDAFYVSKYEAIARGVIAAGKDHRLALIDAPERMVKFYLRHWGVDSAAAPYVDLHERTPAFVDSVVRNGQGPVFYGQSSGGTPENIARLQGLLPFILERHDMVEGQTFLFAGTRSDRAVEDLRTRSTTAPQAVQGIGWKADPNVPVRRDTVGLVHPAQWDLSGREWGADLEMGVYQLARMDNDVIELTADVAGSAPNCGLRLVVELHAGDSTVFYRSEQLAPGTGRRKLWVAVKLADMDDHGQTMRLKAYLWNEGMKAVHVSALGLQVREGDPWLYGFYQPLRGPLAFR